MTRSQFVLGLLFVAVGVLLLADQFELITARSVLAEWWPMIVVAAGVAQFVTRRRNPVGGLLLVAVGGALLLWSLGAVVSVAVLWPILLIVTGLWIVVGRAAPRGRPVVGGTDVVALFDDRSVRAPGGPYDGGSVTAVFGDVDVDLCDATLEEGATLQVSTVFGDVTVRVPDGWQVTASGPELFGDVTVRDHVDAPPGAPVLRLRVVTVFGDVTVRGAPRTATAPASVSAGR